MRRRVLRLGAAVHTALYRLTGGRVGGRYGPARILLLTVTGRRSGKRRTTPLLFTREGDYLVLIASVGGAPHHPAWYLNLRGREAEVRIGRQRIRVRARDAEGEERERLWAEMVSLYPGYAEYQKRTTRRIPVVILEPSERRLR